MLITRQTLRYWDACYSDEKIATLVPAEGLTPLQILDLDIPPQDRLWVVLREEVIPARELRLLACLWARRALSRVKNPDPRSLHAIEVSERFARGEATEEELLLAQDAARYADGYDAARAAVFTAYASARAARSAADAAARADAADAAAVKDERSAQIEDVCMVLEKIGDKTCS
jgi:hypothetical protein